MAEQENEVDPIFEIDQLVKEVYNIIGEWHNDDGSSPGLKQLSLELVEKIAGAAFEHVGKKSVLKVEKN